MNIQSRIGKYLFITFLICSIFNKISYGCNDSPCFCIQVNEIGQVSYTWDNSSFSFLSFQEHQFFADTGNGFVQVGSQIDVNQTSFQIPNYYMSNNNPQFFIKTIYGSSNSLINISDTISSISISLTDQFDGTVSLTWNHPIAYDSIPLTATYKLEKSLFTSPPTSANWTTVAVLSKDSISYVDHIGGCSLFINYRVKLVTDNCEFISNMDGGLIEDQQAPDAPVLTSVDTDTSNNYLTINWLPSEALDVSAYIIFKFSNGVWNPMDTIYGFQNTSYIDTAITTFQNNIVQYAISAMDSCSSGTPPQNNTSSAGLEHQNILLTKDYDQCSGEVKLNWNSYVNFLNGLKYYKLYYKNDLTPWILLDSLTQNNYSYYVQQGDLNYSFLVKAVDSLEVHNAISNKLDFFANQPPIPQVSYLSSVNVYADTIRVIYIGENNIGISQVNFYRSSDNGQTFENVHSKVNPVFPIVFDDLKASPSDKSYLYQVSVIDSCDNEVAYSNVGSSILLEKKEESFLTNELEWTSYKEWQYGVENYEVMILNNTLTSYQLLGFSDSSNLSFSHDFEDFISYPFDGKQCYKVLAIENNNDLGVMGQSVSNELCFQHPPLVFIPNAININGLNNNWKPIINMIDFFDYKVMIFNRNGELIYQLNNYDDSWNGTILETGRLAPIGVYIYLIEFKNSSSQSFVKKGHITLVN